jgi:hypothetical protein
VIAALDDATQTLNQVFAEAFDGFTFGEECGDKCIDWSLTYSQVAQKLRYVYSCLLSAGHMLLWLLIVCCDGHVGFTAAAAAMRHPGLCRSCVCVRGRAVQLACRRALVGSLLVQP